MRVPAIINDIIEPQPAFQVSYAEPRTLECPRPKRQLDIYKLATIKEKRVRFAPGTIEYIDRRPLRTSPFPADITHLDLALTTVENDTSPLTPPPTPPAMHVRFAAEITIIPRPADSFDHVLSAIDFNTTHLDNTGKTCPVMHHMRFADDFTGHSHAHDVFPFVYVRDGESLSVSHRGSLRPLCAGDLERPPSLDNFVSVAENCRKKRRFRKVCGKVRGLFKERKSKLGL
ncbi:hypothetical protein BDW75DRAFT_230398 [Aspergillus navahoensis]